MVWWQSLVGPAFPLIVAALFVAVLVLRPFRSRRQRQREARAAEAARLGISYLPPGGAGVRGPVDEGNHRFSGVTDAVAWTVDTMLLADQNSAGASPDAPHASRSYNRWTSPVEADHWSSGYLLLISRSAEANRPEFHSELLDGLVRQMAELALMLSVRAYFGESRGGRLVLTPQQRRRLGDEAIDAAYAVYSDAPQRLARLNPATRAWLLEHRAMKPAVLWDGVGLAVSCPVDRIELPAVAELAKHAVQLAGLQAAPTEH